MSKYIKKGRGSAWNKGRTGVYTAETLARMRLSASKRTIPPAQRAKIAASKLGKSVNADEKNGTWVGDRISYSGLHGWIARKLGRPKYCAFCQTTEAKMFDWANVSKAYKRDLSDWVRLCRKCHIAYDKGKIIL